MKRKIIFLAVLLMGVSATLLRAADVAFVYPTEEVIRSGKPLFGSVVSDGILAPADAVLAAGGEVFVGLPDGAVKKASLVRLDKDLNVALLRLGDSVLNPELQAAHRKRVLQFQTFLPSQISTATIAALESPQDLGVTLISSGTAIFKITFNGAPITKDVVHFKAWLNKKKISVELLAISTEPVRGFSFRIHSSPTLTFASLESSLSRTLMPGFDYEYKSDATLKTGKTFKFPLEARGVNAKDYEWILEVKADGHLQQEKVFVHFD